ncbi:unnamed protein product [Blepharisma stoltei]|uniref:AB hydrolase-1 domain-containing protein n=1 Tax=Blepharisma stoltei TaxID=1481888 RepID=A0AAU9JK73_9CILI|nr:unnamed protein product [Blepharisma stoltei]
MDLIRCCFCCTSTFGCRDKITRSFAFHPPKPPGYIIEQVQDAYQMLLIDENGCQTKPIEVGWVSSEIITLKTERKQIIPAIYFKNVHAVFTLIFSHGNSTDIGIMRNFIADLSVQLKVNVFIYEYSGYGQSTGKPSEKNIYADIKAAYDYLINVRGISWKYIVLYGQSIGTVPSCELASWSKVGGVILHGPIASALHMFSKKVSASPWFDFFSNISKIPYIKCPIFLLHGIDDKQIPLKHAERLASFVRYGFPPWWVKNAGHNDIEIKHRREYLNRLKMFIESIYEIVQLPEDELDNKFKPFDRRIPLNDLPGFNDIKTPRD